MEQKQIEKIMKETVKEIKKMLTEPAIPLMERWHMRVLYDMFQSNELEHNVRNFQIIFTTYQKITQMNIMSHSSLRQLRKQIRDLNLKLEF